MIVIRPDRTSYILHCFPKDTLPLRDLQDIVEGPIEVVDTVLSKGWVEEKDMERIVLVVNEEGKMQGLPVNRDATRLSLIFHDVIVGNAVLMGVRGEDLIGFSLEEAERICKKWGLRNE